MLGCAPQKNYIDLTLGGAGHGLAILERTGPDGKLWGLDRDAAAIDRCKKRLAVFGDRVQLIHAPMSRFDEHMAKQDLEQVSGVLIDCGVSSFQLDEGDRGFSFRFDAPLDMRMDQRDQHTALDLLCELDERELADVLYYYGEERYSRRIAKAIHQKLASGTLATTMDLADLVFHAYPSSARHQKIHPATKTFQALRMKVNDELGEIEKTLQKLIQICPQACRITVLSFHSIEDRLIKHVFRQAKQEKKIRWLNQHVVVAGKEEQKANPRSRSAKLRGIEIL